MTDANKTLIVYTDLDGTLLDHNNYSFKEATPALNQLATMQVPVIPVTSKTLSEVISITQEAGLMHPVIVENGSIIAFPENYFENKDEYYSDGKYWYKQVSTSYDVIIKILEKIRDKTHFNFNGFSDMSVDEVVKYTGLTYSDAENAKQREGTEPLIWLGTNEERLIFEKELHQNDLTLTKGGRFWHVMGRASKGNAIEIVNNLYLSNKYEKISTLGLGDSPNDISMLKVVDVPVIVQTIDGNYMTFENSDLCYKTKYPGPKGWSQFLLHYLCTFSDKEHNELKRERFDHG